MNTTHHYKFVDGQGSRFRVEQDGEGHWDVIVPSEGGYGEDTVTKINRCQEEWLAARLFQLMTMPNAESLAKNIGVGVVCATKGVDDWLGSNSDMRADMMLCIIRHASGDHGCVDEKTRDANLANTLDGRGPVLSAYELHGRKVRVGTNSAEDSSRPAATVVFFEEETGGAFEGVVWQ